MYEHVQQTVSNSQVKSLQDDSLKKALLKIGLSKKADTSAQNFSVALPKDEPWILGEAIDNGDCFYDAIAQALASPTHTLKSLRVLCSNYIHQLNRKEPHSNWVKAAIEKDKFGIDSYQDYLSTVQYTQEEMSKFKQESNFFTGYAIWGKSDIEGRILADRLGIMLHIIEYHEDEVENGEKVLLPMHALITASGVKSVEAASVNYQDKQMIHLAVYHNHFVPILGSGQRLEKDAQADEGKYELTQFNENFLYANSINSWEIGYSDICLAFRQPYLGRGTYGEVYKWTWQDQEVALKRLLVGKLSSDIKEKFRHEVQIMAQLNSPYVVKFYKACSDDTNRCYCIMMEYMQGGSLDGLLQSRASLDWPTRTQLALDIGYGLTYLHNNKILHRDLKSMNVLLDSQGHAKLCDFGLAEVKDETRSATTGTDTQGTPAWMAPELFESTPNNKIHHTYKSDIYSYGV